MSYATHENKLAGRYTALDSNAKATAAIKAAQEAIEALTAKETLRDEMEAEMKNLSPKLRKMFADSMLNLNNEVDAMRLNVATVSLGIRGAVTNHFKGKSGKDFLSMSKEACKSELQAAVELMKSLPQAFPVTDGK